MSDTPRTDAEAARTDGDLPHMNGYVDADFARQLERELAAAQASLAAERERCANVAEYNPRTAGWAGDEIAAAIRRGE